MNEILHRIEIEKTPAELYTAIAERDGLASWWTPMVEARPEVGSVATFRFGDGNHGPDMRHCNAKRGFFLGVSLKSYLETGAGKPHPEDPSL